jgi:hypothetical protein
MKESVQGYVYTTGATWPCGHVFEENTNTNDMKRQTINEHQTEMPAKAAKQGEVEDSSPCPHNAFTEGVADVNGELLSNNAAFLDTATIPPTLPFPPPGFPCSEKEGRDL